MNQRPLSLAVKMLIVGMMMAGCGNTATPPSTSIIAPSPSPPPAGTVRVEIFVGA